MVAEKSETKKRVKKNRGKKISGQYVADGSSTPVVMTRRQFIRKMRLKGNAKGQAPTKFKQYRMLKEG